MHAPCSSCDKSCQTRIHNVRTEASPMFALRCRLWTASTNCVTQNDFNCWGSFAMTDFDHNFNIRTAPATFQGKLECSEVLVDTKPGKSAFVRGGGTKSHIEELLPKSDSMSLNPMVKSIFMPLYSMEIPEKQKSVKRREFPGSLPRLQA